MNFNPSNLNKVEISVLSMEAKPTLKPLLQEAFAETEPAISPDGRWLAYWSDESGSNALYVTPFPGPGGKYQIASDGQQDLRAQWGPDGREIYYMARDSTMKAVAVTPQGSALQIGASRTLFKSPLVVFWLLDREGKRFLLGTLPQESQSAPITLQTQWTRKLRVQ